MRLAVLAASGPTGRQLTTQALARGHDVVALVRTPSRLDDLVADHPRLEVRRADVLDAASVLRALEGADAVVSGLGIGKGDPAGTLEAGARAVGVDGDRRIVWLGALGAGASKGYGGPLYHGMLRAVLRDELDEKARADEVALAAGATVVHPGPLGGPTRGGGRLVALGDARRRLIPPRVGRADLATAMLDEAEHPRHGGAVVGAVGVAA